MSFSRETTAASQGGLMITPFVYAECRISSGSFSGECVFEIDRTDGQPYVGLAPRRDCRNKDGQKLRPNEPEGDKKIDGKVAARVVSNGGNDAIIAIPDGEAIKVPVALLSPREADQANVFIRS